MIHEMLAVGPLQCNCSIFGDEVTREAMVVDPGDDIDRILAIVARHELRIESIVITHAHIDHIGGAEKLKRVCGAPVWMSPHDQVLYDHLEYQASWLGVPTPEKTSIDTPARDGDLIRCGDVDFGVMHTPGHTQGSICLWAPALQKLVAGDTLFRDSIGRTDFPGGDAKAIFRSIRTKLLVLPEEAIVIPGHGPTTTIGREKEWNPFLQNL